MSVPFPKGDPAQPRSKFPPLFWLVVVFEFFERGSYYGMMSVFSVYLTDVLDFPKEDVGLIKGTIQPLLYFLPIISGALADRFGYRRTLMVAFALLGGGYLLTAQATSYALVFAALVVMGLGAGTFKPVISGTIARCTDGTNSTIGFGIFYWSINLGAFLFPLFLVPFLKSNMGWDWVIIAAAIGTGAMLIPTFLFFKEPPAPQEADDNRASLLQTLANAFEIIYSPLVRLSELRRSGSVVAWAMTAILVVFPLGLGAHSYFAPVEATSTFSMYAVQAGPGKLVVKVARNLCSGKVYEVDSNDETHTVKVVLHDPQRLEAQVDKLTAELAESEWLVAPGRARLLEMRTAALDRTTLAVVIDDSFGTNDPFRLQVDDANRLVLAEAGGFAANRDAIMASLAAASPALAALTPDEVGGVVDKAGQRSFLLLYVGLLLLAAFVIIGLAPGVQAAGRGSRIVWMLGTLAILEAIIWGLPGLSVFARVVSGVISVTVLSLYAIDYREMARFSDHLKFLLMIFIYAGFWVLYFQMFDSVLWYVQAYVDAGALNAWVNGLLAGVGLDLDWRFDVEHVTVINAGTIILLQLAVSNVVKNTRALPTMIVGIAMGTVGMAILAISTSIWVFIAGTIIFSIGEMTAHPKFISYVGQTAPQSRVAMYMGYVFLYGVIGSSIGGVLGAKLYVKFVDEMNQPQTLWLIFTAIGVATVVGLLLFNRFLARKEPA